MITVVNYGSGNIRAITNIYKNLNIPVSVAVSAEDLDRATKLVLPGVGAFDATMAQLNASKMRYALDQKVLEDGVPVLGICVGMQIMAKSSEEGAMQGLAWVDAHVKKFNPELLKSKPHLPHLGWNTASPIGEPALLKNILVTKGFYFLHSFYFECQNPDNIIATTDYGINFTSAINAGNIHGAQFHPEKSHQNGIQIFKNFAEIL